ncbi:hypothetical protein HanRHA438_Chr01g0006871 [Helianthus annuus]|nr:hypothetical protein HanRHA438_Chr01g0006871 [Helianthus annuus]
MLVGAAKSSKSASRFSVADLQDIASPRSLKKELAASQSNPEPIGMSTRGKGTKRKKPAETSEGLPLMERQLHDYVSEKFTEVQILVDQRLAEADEKSLDLQKIALAKDKKSPPWKRTLTCYRRSYFLLRSQPRKRGPTSWKGPNSLLPLPC